MVRDGAFDVDRTWSPGDRVTLELPMEWRWIKGRGMQTGRAALMRGPLVYGLNPDRNPAAAGMNLRDLTLDPASLGEATPDSELRPGGTSVVVGAWPPSAEKPGLGEADRKRLDHPNSGTAVAGRGSAPLKLILTEFADPQEKEIYFRLTPTAKGEDDELLTLP